MGELLGAMLRKQIASIRQNMIETQKEIRALSIENKNTQIKELNTKMEQLRNNFTDINDQYEKYLKNKIDFERRNIELRMRKHTCLVKFKQEENALNEKLLILQEFKEMLQSISKALLLNESNYHNKDTIEIKQCTKKLNQIKQMLSKIDM